MSQMEFLGQNILDTTSMFFVDSGSGTLSYLYDRNKSLDYATDGYTGNTSTTINIVFGSATNISRIILQNHNLKSFKIYYDSATANTFNPDASFAQNSATNHYISFATTAVSSIQIQMDDVINTGEERSIGELIVSDCKTQFERNPTAENYDPKLFKQKIKHTMPDGGTSLFVVGNKFQAGIKFKYISTVFKNELMSVYNSGDPFYFIPEPTTSAWLGDGWEVVWTTDWDFTYSENSKTQGWEGTIRIEETPGA